MVKRKKDEPDNKAAERLKQLMDARKAVPDEEQAQEKPVEKKPEDKPGSRDESQQAPEKQKDC
jgi:hypothetical protein